MQVLVYLNAQLSVYIYTHTTGLSVAWLVPIIHAMNAKVMMNRHSNAMTLAAEPFKLPVIKLNLPETQLGS